MCSTAGSRTGVLSISGCHSVGGFGTGAAPAPFPSTLPTSKERSSLTARAALSLMPGFFFSYSIFITNLLQTVMFHRGTFAFAILCVLPACSTVGEVLCAPCSVCAPNSAIATSLIFSINEQMEMLIFTQKIRAVCFLFSASQFI